MAATATAPRRKRTIGTRRRTEDDDNDEGIDALDLDDDSMTEGSVVSDEHDPADDSDTSNIDETSPTIPNAKKTLGNGAAKHGARRQAGAAARKSPAPKPADPAIAETGTMLDKLSLSNKEHQAEELEFDDVKSTVSVKENAPVIVSSASYSVKQPRAPVHEQKRREHEEYRKARDADPAFVPNRGAFFLHDHRHSGPAANGFRPSGRPIRGRERGPFGGPFPPRSQFQSIADVSVKWEHDMHQEVAEPPMAHRPTRQMPEREGPPNGNGIIPYAPAPKEPINRAMSTEKTYATTTVRVFIPTLMKEPKTFPGMVLKVYTKLPDHRPPLRRDKPVRISLPDHAPPIMPRYVFPAHDRSFVFIPRALRPNQQRARGRGPRSIIGSGGFSRRTSIWGGSIYGSIYSPSVALSRRSSIAPDIGREFILSPTGSAISRAPMPVDGSRPVVRLPPSAQSQVPAVTIAVQPSVPAASAPAAGTETSISDLPPPQTHPLPQKPTFQENKPANLPIHQPRPQKTVSVENIESPVRPANVPTPFQQAFHHQVPPQMPNGYVHDVHARHPSYHSQVSAATPLSQIPERAIHAAPFQPNTFAQPGYYAQSYPMQQQPGYYYPPPQPYATNMGPNANAPAFVPGGQQGPPPVSYAASAQGDATGQAQAQNLVTQELNGTVYYFNANELPAAVAGFPPPYPPPQQYAVGMVPPVGPDGFYYPQPAPGMVYYPQ